MGRPLRIDEPGLVHHVYGQASDHRQAFRDDIDRALLEELLGEACRRYSLSVLAYCFLSTHYHVALQSHDGRLSEAMQWILSNYVRRFNQRHETNGALFSGRFRSVRVESPGQLLLLVRYIHANALDIAGVEAPERYRWSSCGAHSGGRPAPRWLMRSAVAYVLRNDTRLSKSATKSRRSRHAALHPARVPDTVVQRAIKRFASGFAVPVHPRQPRNKSPG